eukprot:8517111-Pyramimonas_sp.AAC.1
MLLVRSLYALCTLFARSLRKARMFLTLCVFEFPNGRKKRKGRRHIDVDMAIPGDGINGTRFMVKSGNTSGNGPEGNTNHQI